MKYLLLIFNFQVGDYIEKINGKSVVGCRHFEVSKMLKDIPKGTTFILSVVKPLIAGYGTLNIIKILFVIHNVIYFFCD